MCGFVGCFQSSGEPVPAGVLERMGGAIRHRGPDDEGQHWLSFRRGISVPHSAGQLQPNQMDAGFAFARLSIQDLTQAGHQPMSSADGLIVLVFNGEIYNAPALREALRSSGAMFIGHSDTEVILRLYERHGWDGLLARIEGMYAIAIADLHTRRLHAARDPFGIKPFYYTQTRGTLLIASEIKAFLAHPEFVPDLETDHLPEQLMFRYCAWNRTLLRGVKQLPPGHSLTWQPGQPVTLQRYWTLPAPANNAPSDPVGTVGALLQKAVQRQMIGDVPVGTQLSGGIDSSLVTLHAQRLSSQPLHTFSVLFDEPGFSEEPWITQAARHTGVLSHCSTFSAERFVQDLDKVTWHLDAPPAQPNAIALYQLAAAARQKVKVLLTGEGCDELFAGYNRFYYAAMQARHPLLFKLGSSLNDRRSSGRLGRLFGQAHQSWERQVISGSAYGTSTHILQRLLPDVRLDQAFELRQAHLEGIPGPPLQRQIRYETETYLPDLLLRQDKMTMAHSVECRVPFLDDRLATTARDLPPNWLASPQYGLNARMRGTKRVIKKLAATEFGPAFAYRRKRGFDVPLASFFRHPLFQQRMADEWLPAIRQRGMMEPSAVENLWKTFISNRNPTVATTNAEALWVAVGLETWVKQTLTKDRFS